MLFRTITQILMVLLLAAQSLYAADPVKTKPVDSTALQGASPVPSPRERKLPESPEPELFLHCGEKDEMGTPFKICIYTPSANKITAVEDVAQGFAILKKIDGWMSDW